MANLKEKKRYKMIYYVATKKNSRVKLVYFIIII